MRKFKPREKGKSRLIAVVFSKLNPKIDLIGELKIREKAREEYLASIREERTHYCQIENGVGRLYERLRKQDYKLKEGDEFLLHICV